MGGAINNERVDSYSNAIDDVIMLAEKIENKNEIAYDTEVVQYIIPDVSDRFSDTKMSGGDD